MIFSPGLSWEREPAEGYWFVFRGDDLLVRGEASPLRAADASRLPVEVDGTHVVGTLDGAPVYAAAAKAGAEIDGEYSFAGLRRLFGVFGEELFRVAGTAKQVVTWDRDHRYCGRCGTVMEPLSGERAKKCPACGHHSFPRLSPAIITAVVRGDRLLLARARRFPPGLYSVIAGFVEVGETLEECVAREVREEVGLEVTDIRYFGSQSWPFPHSFMVAFTARHAAGEIRIDETEIREAAWFRRDELPLVPDRASISRRLIDWFVDGAAERP